MDGEIDAESLADRLDDSDPPLVLDIRNPEAFRQGHIPGSENVPLGRLTGDIKAVEGAEHVVTVCPHGKASVQAARLVAAYEGFSGRVDSLAGGLTDWDGPVQHVDEDGADSRSPDAPF